MGRLAAVAAILWASSAFPADSPSALFGISNEVGSSPRVHQVRVSEALPAQLEGLLLRPEVTIPAPPAAPERAASSPAGYSNLWDRIRGGFGIPQVESPLVERWQAWYLARPQILKAVLDRSRRYLFHVVEEVSKRGMPMELALLPVIESGYNPVAVSTAQASGLWQFIPSTARSYNLLDRPDYDARRDVIASTSAALDYLESLYDQFGDWQLALAAYNWGEGSVMKAIERNAAKGLGTGYLALALPDETRNYLPKLQAIKNLITDPAVYGFKLDPIANQPYFGTVTTARALDAAAAARLAGVPVEELLLLNPGRIRLAEPGNAIAGLVLPVERVGTFLVNLQFYRNAHTPPRVSRSVRRTSSPSVAEDPREARAVVQ